MPKSNSDNACNLGLGLKRGSSLLEVTVLFVLVSCFSQSLCLI